jgi:hypothetical protein
VEPVTGFPAGTPSAWSAAEQRELADFLRDTKETQARFLLTSRRDERGWLGELPARVTMPPMPMQERIQLAKALAARHGKPLTAVDDWRPLLQLTGGNPLTLTVVVGQALRDGRPSASSWRCSTFSRALWMWMRCARWAIPMPHGACQKCAA